MASKIKVLIVDDSVVYRELLRKGLNEVPGIEVVATAIDPYDARDKLLKYRPDVMVCDIEMPKMNGLTFLRKVLPQYPIPTIVISSLDNAAFEAMEAGAVDFVGKCASDKKRNQEEFVMQVAEKVKIAKDSKVLARKTRTTEVVSGINKGKIGATKVELIALGASTGGTEALASVIAKLPNNIPGIVIVQHIPPMFSTMFAQRINRSTDFEVMEATTGDEVRRGRILIAPGDKQMRVVRKNGKLVVEVKEGPKVSGHCPSVDVLFQSVAETVGSKAVGVIMTGMGADGAKGLLAMRQNGAQTIGQDEESCVVYGMPKEAYKMGAVQKQASLMNIPRSILEML
ncbi:MAG: chemotaxis response regulator protein-glutamate methylesterase [Lachnospiraceae bacterium]|nr:chemotaxis response regulator protein-glutamate methylesterase [Lachnospiraceae bacterium]